MAITTTTPNLNIRQLKITVGHADLSAAATTNSEVIYTLTPRSQIMAAFAQVTENFTGGAISAYTLSVGHAPFSSTRVLLDFVAFSGTTSTALMGNINAGVNEVIVTNMESTDYDIKIYATSTDADLDAATAGSVDIYLIVAETT